MSDSQQTSWSNDPNAPNVSYPVYNYEKTYFAGIFIGSALYGIIIVLFFRCMVALLDPVHRRGERIKWGLVSYTMVMFSLVTIGNAVYPYLESISYIDNREFSGIEGVVGPGPLAYQMFVAPIVLQIIPNVSFTLSNWLADGLLLYRCYVIYSKNLWVIAFPCLMYLGSFAMGIAINYQDAGAAGVTWSALPYYSISLSLNTLLTLMIVIRLIVHAKNTRSALGMAGIGGLSKAIVTMLVESSALYAVSSLLVIGSWSANTNPIVNLFLAVLYETQVIAPLLIIQRVANKSALTSNNLVPGRLSSFEARSRGELTDDSGALTGEDSASSANQSGAGSGDPGVGVNRATASSHQDA